MRYRYMRFGFGYSFIGFIRLLLVTVVFSSSVYAGNKKHNDGDGLFKGKYFVLVPASWADSNIAKNFGKNFERLDTNFIGTASVKRVVVHSDYFHLLPALAAHYPGITDLVICGNGMLSPEMMAPFSELLSFSVSETNLNPDGSYPRYVEDDMPQPIYTSDWSAILAELPTLREFYYEVDMLYLPEEGSHDLHKLDAYGFRWTPVYMYSGGILDENILVGIPYPELIALGYTGYFSKEKDPLEYDFVVDALNDTIMDFWYEDKKNVPRPHYKKPPLNGEFRLNYDNGDTLVCGNMNNGEPDGEWEWFYQDGKLCERRNYKNGKEEGDWIFIDTGGDTTNVYSFANGKLDHQAVYEYTVHRLYTDTSIVEYTKRKRMYKQGEWRSFAEIHTTYYVNKPNDTLTYVTYSGPLVGSFDGKQSGDFSLSYYKDRLVHVRATYNENDSQSVMVEYDGNSALVRRCRDFCHHVRGNNGSSNLACDSTIDSTWYSGHQLHTVSVIMKYYQYRVMAWDSTGRVMLEGQYTRGSYGRDTADGVIDQFDASGKIFRKDVYTSECMHTSRNYGTNCWHAIVLYDKQGNEKEEWVYRFDKLDYILLNSADGKTQTLNQFADGVMVKSITRRHVESFDVNFPYTVQ